ncbi:MAG: bifunctional acetate--CoA ligase family protein/GNAT family N-acetyltransferase [Gammaproteobacteria bacterium]|nr:bifunctional acetate--CoA ligase family protein/GNAT family N-acetyltransferase [Gammaproteobacteria bacterium]
MGTHFLDCLFSPQSIAVFGASERSDAVGGRVFDNLRKGGFSGPIYGINPKYKRLYHEPCYPSITNIGKPVDLVVIATPAPTIAEIIHACGEQGVRTAIIISTGFSEGDGCGTALKKAVLEAARQYQIRILGPNCLGLIRPAAGINATFSKNTAKSGQLALVSQSGALCTAILDWAVTHDIGFSTIVSLGDAADIDFGDILDYLAQDPLTHSILLYVEGVRDARSFMSGLRIAARMKPVIVIKAGRHDEGSRAAITHTGAMIGDDDIFDAALQRAGVVRAMTIEQLFAAAQLLASRHRVSGNRLAIVTNGGGLGVMAIDRAIDLGVSIASLSEETLANLDMTLPPHWSHRNPIDLLGDASPERYQAAVKACLADPGVDGVLVMLSPQAMTDTEACAQAVIDAQETNTKPVLACWMGEQQVEAANLLFGQHQLPSFPNPESSVEAFAYLASYYQNQQLLMQVPGPLVSRSEPDVDGARLIIESVLAQKRSVLSISESKALLHAFAIPVTQSIECHSANDTLVAAELMDFPVAMKINSPDITHKSDVGGIRLNISNAHAIRSTYHELLEAVNNKYPDAKIEGVTVEPMYTPPYGRELLIGVIRDPIFGPAITFGAGGIQVEVLRDRAIALPPLNTFLIEKMISQTHISQLLGSFRNMPAVKMDALVQVLRRVSEMVCELPEIKALDINPLIADEKGVMALDARIVIAHPVPSLDRYAHMAIHPYPNHLVSLLQLSDGTNIKIRPIRPEDAAIEQSFVRELSPQSKYFRFMQGLNELTQQMLVRFTQLDYNRELALIAVLDHPDKETELGVARYVMNPDGKSCEFALVVADKWQHKGIGSHLMTVLINAAHQSGIKAMDGEILANNHNMLKLAKNLGFSVHTSTDDPGLKAVTKQL